MAPGRNQPTAEDLAEEQREISIAEFFNQNEQMLGFGSRARAMVTAVKEGVDNAIDAAEEAGVLPDVSVTINTDEDTDHYLITIVDNGPGITKPQVPKVFGKLLYGSRFAKRVQKRGQQGIGISAAVMYGQQTTGKPATVVSKTARADTAEYFSVGIDTDTNEPVIQESHATPWPHDSSSGTSITIPLDATFRARSALHRYIQRTAIVNPHATVALSEPELDIQYDRTVSELPTQPTEIKPHPHGIEFGTLRSLIEQTETTDLSEFLQLEFTRVGPKTSHRVLDNLQDRTEGRLYQIRVPGASHVAYPRDVVSDGDSVSLGFQTELSSGSVEYSTPAAESVDSHDAESDHSAVTFANYISDHVNRKDQAATELFVSTIISRLREVSPVCWTTVKQTVHTAATKAEDEFDERFGPTVRSKSTAATWRFLSASRKLLLYTIVSQSTSELKTESDIVGFTHALHTNLESTLTDHGALRQSEVEVAVSDAAVDSQSQLKNAFGDTAQRNVTETLWNSLTSPPSNPPSISDIESDRDLADMLHKAMHDTDVMAPPSHCLSPIGEEDMVSGMKKAYDADVYSATTRDASAHSGEPFLIETGIAYGGDIESGGNIQLLRFANRVPLVYKKGGCATTSVVSNISWNNYKLSDKGTGLPQGPVVIAIHIASTNVPFTSESKDAVASVDIVKNEIERAVREVARDLKSYLKAQQKQRNRTEKQDKIADILPVFAKKVSEMTDVSAPSTEEPLARVMNNLLLTTAATESQDQPRQLQLHSFDQGSSFDPVITLQTECNPDTDSSRLSVSQPESGSHWTVTWNPTVSANKSQSVSLPVARSSITHVDVSGVSADKIILDVTSP